MSIRGYAAFWLAAIASLVLVGRWMLRDYADYCGGQRAIAERLERYVG